MNKFNSSLADRLAAVRSLAASGHTHFAAPLELPEPDFRLDLASRNGDPRREFLHLHQMCMLHAANFQRANHIKTVALLDGYLAVVDSVSAPGPYLFARTILELAAFVREVTSRLNDIVSKPEEKQSWRSKGEEYFAVVVRARLATTHPVRKAALEAAGLGAQNLKPFNVMQCLKNLCADDRYRDFAPAYDALCDFVHHNLSSQVAGTGGFRVSDAALSPGGGGILMPQTGPVTLYEYPLTLKANEALAETIDIVNRAIEVCIELLNKMAHTPFSSSLILQMTGTSLGFKEFPRRQ